MIETPPKDHTLQVRATRDLVELIDAAAAKHGCSRSVFIRLMLKKAATQALEQ